MNACNFQIDLQCPQCGAPAVLDETETIIQCGFCRTRNIIHTVPYPCYYIAPRPSLHPSLPVIYVPYWRFKGLSFFIGPCPSKFRVVDHSFLAVQLPAFPKSLGLRSQTQTLRFMHKGIKGSFLPPGISRKKMLARIEGNAEKTVHIGEILSLIYMPFCIGSDMLYDGLSGKPVSFDPPGLPKGKGSPDYRLRFSSCLCPGCGWDLAGETDSLVLYCNNCVSTWLIHEKRLNRFDTLFYEPAAGSDMYLPFWRFQVTFDTMAFDTMADVVRQANIPRMVTGKDEQQPFYFYVPAFKLNPKLFLRIARQVTLAGIRPGSRRSLPDKGLHPVDLPLNEGFQAVPTILLEMATNKREIWQVLAREKMTLNSFALVYMGFAARGSECIQQELGFSLQINSLKFGRRL